MCRLVAKASCAKLIIFALLRIYEIFPNTKYYQVIIVRGLVMVGKLGVSKPISCEGFPQYPLASRSRPLTSLISTLVEKNPLLRWE